MYLPRRLRYRLHDALHNHLFVTSRLRFLVVRGYDDQPYANDVFLRWLMQARPQALMRIELTRAPGRLPRPLKRYDLLIPWVQDPCRERNGRLFRCLQRWQHAFDQQGVRTINRVEHLSNSIKSTALATLADSGLLVPRAAAIHSPAAFLQDQAGLNLPLFVRGDQRHGGPVFLVETPADLQRINWRQLEHPVAIEYVDVRSSDGLFRKYRAFTIGRRTLPRHMVASTHWFVHAADRVREHDIHEQELAYIAHEQDPNHAALQRAKAALKLDYAAFDYSYTPDGRMIIWEVNPLPLITWRHYDTRYDYHLPCLARIYAAMLELYCEAAAGDDVPLSSPDVAAPTAHHV